jgi:ABC-type Fe3+/spermidine/putrescine transport system ATPase subunit
MSLLKVSNLSLEINNSKILENISFSLENNEVLSILGPSGSGKSSILRLIAGLIKPNKGDITFLEKVISSKNKIVPTGERNIGLMFQEDVLFPHLNVFKNIAFGLKSKKNKDLVNSFLYKFGLFEKKDSYPSLLSGGEKQRVSLARVLITNPKILLMDEPFSNLDNNLRKEICDHTIENLKKNKMSVIFVTHDVEEALRVSDKIIILNKGKILQIGSPKSLYRQPITKYVAQLLGSINQFETTSDKQGNLVTPFGEVNCTVCSKETSDCKERKNFCVIRPEHLQISKNGVKAKIVNRYFHGASWAYKVFLRDELPLFNITNCKEELMENEEIMIDVECKNILIFQE